MRLPTDSLRPSWPGQGAGQREGEHQGARWGLRAGRQSARAAGPWALPSPETLLSPQASVGKRQVSLAM